MPVYEYRCDHCGKVSEFLVGAAQNNAEIRCVFCGGGKMEKLFSKSVVKMGGNSQAGGRTCCGRPERCDTPPCSVGECAR